MADELAGLSKLQFLVIDDFANFTATLRDILRSLGAVDVDTASNGEDAIAQMQQKRYDVVLCDYNLGDGKNGNDVLEEAKIHRLVKSSAIYILITAESASDMVRGALEYQPDDYLTKPLTKDVLTTRLVRIRTRNRIFTDVLRCRDRGDLVQAVKLLPAVIKANPRYKRYAQRLWTEILMEAKQYEKAHQLYKDILQEKPLAWAMLGLGKSFYYQGDHERAKRCFENLLEQDKAYVQAWDWLARCQREMGDLEAAKGSLVAAVAISPINVRRQMQLGEVAMEAGDDDRAERAFSRAVKVGKHSIFRSPDAYLNMTDLLVKKLDGAEGLNAKRLESKAMEAMDELRRLYRDDPSVAAQSRFAEHRVHASRGREAEAEKSLSRAYEICKNDPEGRVSGAIKEQLISELEKQGRTDMANELVTAMQQEDSGLNTKAVEYYDKGNLDMALKVLRKAFADKPRSYSVCLNTAQVAMHHIVKNGINKQNMQLAGEALERAKSIPEDDKRYKNLLALQERYSKLQQRQEAAN